MAKREKRKKCEASVGVVIRVDLYLKFYITTLGLSTNNIYKYRVQITVKLEYSIYTQV